MATDTKRETFTDEQVIHAVKVFLELGEDVCDKTNGKNAGYCSGGGFAARALRYHLDELEKKTDRQSCKHEGKFKLGPQFSGTERLSLQCNKCHAIFSFDCPQPLLS